MEVQHTCSSDPKIPLVMTPDLQRQCGMFETFTDFAHHLGATGVDASNARLSDNGHYVELVFSHRDFLNEQFVYRAKDPEEDVHEMLWLAEEIATGALHRIMRDAPQRSKQKGVTRIRLDRQRLRLDHRLNGDP